MNNQDLLTPTLQMGSITQLQPVEVLYGFWEPNMNQPVCLLLT